MERMTIVEKMRLETCRNSKGNCEKCPLFVPCMDNTIDKLIMEIETREEYMIDVK